MNTINTKTLNLVVEGKEYPWHKQFITGAELKSLAGIASNVDIYLSLQDPWDDELVNNDSKVDLSRPGVEHFYLKKELRFTINGKSFSWNKQYITGMRLKKLGDIDAEDEIYLKASAGFEDQLIEDETKVDLARPRVEHFVSKDKVVAITLIVNGRPKEWKEKKISFDQVVVLAFGKYDPNPNIVYTVTYDRGPHQNPEGTMVRGDVVRVKNKMVFNATATDKS